MSNRGETSRKSRNLTPELTLATKITYTMVLSVVTVVTTIYNTTTNKFMYIHTC